jgi:trehalose/maltose hydrolase-like predicted phosphorylase
MYRWHTLPAARAKAERLGYRGALYAWESADTGEETTPEAIVDPDGRLLEVRCGLLEHHISADVAWAVWQYWRTSGDDDFCADAGAEMLLEVARFWASRADADADGAFHIRGVIGPDEYHEDVDDNAFTNVMARWAIGRALATAGWLRAERPARWAALAAALRLDDAEMQAWRRVADGLVTGFDPATGLFEQFRGFFDLEEVDLAQYAGRAVPMDVVLGRERTQASQVVKQADVVAMLAMLPDAFGPGVREANLRYYAARTGHGSSLSRSMFAVVAARLGDVASAERWFRETAATDLADTRGGSAGGVRIAVLGGLWQAAMLGFVGLGVHEDGIAVDPHLPAAWRRVAFRVHWRDRVVHVALDGTSRRLTATLESGDDMVVHVGDRAHRLSAAHPLTVAWTPAAGDGLGAPAPG